MPSFIYRELAWALLVIIGGLGIFLPGGVVVCIACGPLFTTILGVISVVIGIAGFVFGRGSSNPTPGRQ
jgi:hypothetical protein